MEIEKELVFAILWVVSLLIIVANINFLLARLSILTMAMLFWLTIITFWFDDHYPK